MNLIPHSMKKLAMVATATLVLAACASAPSAPAGSELVRNKLTLLQGDGQLATLAPIEIRDAEAAVRLAETPERDAALSRHLVLLADRKVDIARSWAQSRLYEAQRDDLNRQSEQARLDSRTRETDQARRETAVARNATAVARDQAASARGDAASARTETDVARDQTAAALTQSTIARSDAARARDAAETARTDNAATQLENDELTRQVAELNGRDTDRGLVVTLGDVLFATGQATIAGGNTSNLDKLAVFLKRYADRDVTIEGHTDNVGNDDSNMALSQNRANAVRAYLVTEGVALDRFVTSGMGESAPVASNDSATGRQQNRRVEVIIADAR